jgi:hypothetical protein
MKNQVRPRIARLWETARDLFGPDPATLPVWYDSPNICALADSERHLGHAVRVDNHWVAYDAMHSNPDSSGFRIIGTFQTIAAAKDAIESSAHATWVWSTPGATVERAA